MKIIKQAARHLILAAFLVSGCVSKPKKSIVDLEVLLLKSQAEQVHGFKELCSQGITGACGFIAQSPPLPERLSIVQGPTSLEQSRMAVLVPTQARFYYFSVNEQNVVDRLKVERKSNKDSKWAVDHVDVFGLIANHKYHLLVIDERGQLRDWREFQALQVEKPKARIAVVSCLDDQFKDIQKKMWDQLLGQNPDLILMIGDNVYADRNVPPEGTPPKQLWSRYVETRRDLQVFKAQKLIPVLATWDDHDFGKNDSDQTYIHKEASRQVFFSFFPQGRPVGTFEPGPGVASRFLGFGVNWLLLDDRYFRTPNRVISEEQTHFGREQEKWFQDEIKLNGRSSFVISGDQFFGGYHVFESLEGNHPLAFKRNMEQFKALETPLIFVSGDRHLSEIIRVPYKHLGYETFEITSSGMHARVFKEAFLKNPSPHQVVGVAGEYNYSLIDLLKSSPRSVELIVQSFGLDNRLHYQKTLVVNKSKKSKKD